MLLVVGLNAKSTVSCDQGPEYPVGAPVVLMVVSLASSGGQPHGTKVHVRPRAAIWFVAFRP